MDITEIIYQKMSPLTLTTRYNNKDMWLKTKKVLCMSEGKKMDLNFEYLEVLWKQMWLSIINLSLTAVASKCGRKEGRRVWKGCEGRLQREL